MKKKIKDLTLEEMNKICKKNKDCYMECSLFVKSKCVKADVFATEERKDLEKEVEVDE